MPQEKTSDKEFEAADLNHDGSSPFKSSVQPSQAAKFHAAELILMSFYPRLTLTMTENQLCGVFEVRVS